TRRHLLQLLVLRRMIAEGRPTSDIAEVTGRADTELERGLKRAAGSATAGSPPSAALDYLKGLRAPSPSTGTGARHLAQESIFPEPLAELEGEPFPHVYRSALAEPTRVLGAMSLPNAKHRPERWVRVVLRPGLEIHLSDRFASPIDAESLQDLVGEFEALLKDRKTSQ
ncbi:MAG TPA: hypothetical protein VHN99_04505, partial [Deinococcales bacterium]|nr:hypothetical protein [Deinococcales bacterium]